MMKNRGERRSLVRSPAGVFFRSECSTSTVPPPGKEVREEDDRKRRKVYDNADPSITASENYGGICAQGIEIFLAFECAASISVRDVYLRCLMKKLALNLM